MSPEVTHVSWYVDMMDLRSSSRVLRPRQFPEIKEAIKSSPSLLIHKDDRLFRRCHFEEQVPGAHLTDRLNLPFTTRDHFLDQKRRYCRKEINGFWTPSGFKDYPGLNDGAKFSTRSSQEKFAAIGGKREASFFSIVGKTIFPIDASILARTRITYSSMGPPPGFEFPHFSNVPSGAAGGFFKARQRGNTHNVLPGTIQGRNQGGFLDMSESPPPSHPQLRSSPSGTLQAECT
ncbi:hypothetical protein TNCV_3064661 [Trichonephila clavipes]|nr:hypothetical protein TNCV_3064661 [Trichonephila clavipes]